MATKAEIYEAILKPMQGLYVPPSGIKADVALEQYARGLAEFSVAELENGWARLVQGYASRWWPTLHAVVVAVREGRPQQDRRETGPWPLKAKAAMRSPLGRQALQDGVAWAFYCHVHEKGEHPHPGKLAEWTRQKAENLRLMREIAEHPQRFVGARWLHSLGEEMMRRELDMQRRYGQRAA